MSFSANTTQSLLFNQAQHEIYIKQLTKQWFTLAAHGIKSDISNKIIGYGL